MFLMVNALRRISLVLPAYNEAAAIGHSLEEAYQALIDSGREFEILIIDDGSTDNTAEIVTEYAERYPAIRLVRHATNLGYGAALRTGFESATYELVAFSDADGQFFIEDLELLIEQVENFHIVVGRRVDRKDPFLRRFYSWGYNQIVRRLFGTRVHDCDCALKVFHTKTLSYLLPESRGFLVNAEMLSKANRLGFSVTEIPVRHRPRRYGVSKVSLWEIPKTLVGLFHLWHVVQSIPRHAPSAIPVTPLAKAYTPTSIPHSKKVAA
jgi:dolichol-phosphate mannosyltransferase